MTTIIRWLHLTDLHVGMDNQDWLLPGILGKFCEDLETIRPTAGPWDLVLFSGDLVQKGTEYAQLEDIFGKIWDCFKQLDCNPKLLAVPGNHDLQWCKAKHPVVKMLHRWSADPDVAEEFWKEWKDPNGSYHQVITQAFAAYEAWWQGTTRKPDGIQSGLLPGDFSCTFTKDRVRLGIVGLNSAFLQLTEKRTRHAYKGKLVVDPRQFQTVCGGDGVEWAKSHDACFLMTHHPPEWLTTDSCDHLNGEILERFCLHMCGHNHETHVLQQLAGGGEEAPVRWLGRSLFGLEKPRSGKVDRSHGYVAGELHFTDDGRGHFQFTPRRRAAERTVEIRPRPRRRRTARRSTYPHVSGIVSEGPAVAHLRWFVFKRPRRSRRRRQELGG